MAQEQYEVPKVYYPEHLEDGMVVETERGLFVVPLLATGGGWARREPYLGDVSSLTPRPRAESEIQLRTAGWTPGAERLDS